MACIPADATGQANLFVKEDGIIAGMSLAEYIFTSVDPRFKFEAFVIDGDEVSKGKVAFTLSGNIRNILMLERLTLNCMQRMSGIATQTHKLVKQLEGTKTKLIDTRKTTPGIRLLEKWAVRIGGGHNHRFGLYDMVMLKDNHVDGAGGIEKAISATRDYLKKNNLGLKIEIETRNLEEVRQVISFGGADRIMLDNFSPELLWEAVKLIGGKYETEASGGITEANIREYALTGVDFISSSQMTHSVKSLDLSLKLVKSAF